MQGPSAGTVTAPRRAARARRRSRRPGRRTPETGRQRARRRRRWVGDGSNGTTRSSSATSTCLAGQPAPQHVVAGRLHLDAGAVQVGVQDAGARRRRPSPGSSATGRAQRGERTRVARVLLGQPAHPGHARIGVPSAVRTAAGGAATSRSRVGPGVARAARRRATGLGQPVAGAAWTGRGRPGRTTRRTRAARPANGSTPATGSRTGPASASSATSNSGLWLASLYERGPRRRRHPRASSAAKPALACAEVGVRLDRQRAVRRQQLDQVRQARARPRPGCGRPAGARGCPGGRPSRSRPTAGRRRPARPSRRGSTVREPHA